MLRNLPLVPAHLHYKFGTLRLSRVMLEADRIAKQTPSIARRVAAGETVTVMAGDGEPITFGQAGGQP